MDTSSDSNSMTKAAGLSGAAAAAAPGDKTPGDKTPEPQVKRFNNGWTKELEHLFAEWADKAACYRWMHERTGRIFYQSDQSLMFPIIILSTVTGAANFALGSVVNDPTTKNYAQLGLGGLSIISGILTTIANRLGYASGSEAHRTAAISWGKFNRLIGIELSLHPKERMDAFAFMKMFRVELDRLIEQSPSIPENVISAFVVEFKTATDVRKPDIAGELEHTKVFVDTGSRLQKIAQEAAVNIAYKKGILKQMVLTDLDGKIKKIADETLKSAASAASLATIAAAQAKLAAGSNVSNISNETHEKQKADRTAEIVSIQKAKVVGALSKKFAAGSVAGPKPSLPKPLVMVNTIPTAIPQDVIVNVDSEKEKNIYTDFTGSSPAPVSAPVLAPVQDATPVVETESKAEEVVAEEAAATAAVPAVAVAAAPAAPFSIPSPAPVSTVPESELPAGWTQHVGKSGKTFYYNAATKTTQWDRPIA
jgi:hypothetical protein